VQLPDSIETEQARYIHRTVLTAALGSMVVVGLVWLVFHNVVSPFALDAWVGAFVVLTLVRVVVWWRYRAADFAVQGRCRGLEWAIAVASVSAVGNGVTLVANDGGISAGQGNSVSGNTVSLVGTSIGAGGAALNTTTSTLKSVREARSFGVPARRPA
jgi:hypothetical protein